MAVRSVILTPPAFDKSNPDAQKNIAKANAAVARMDDVLRQKADLLRELVDELFGGIEHLAAALCRELEHDSNVENAGVVAEEFAARYRALDTQHTAAGQELFSAMAGQ